MRATIIVCFLLLTQAAGTLAPAAGSQFRASYVAGTSDFRGQPMGGTELMNIVAHEGKLYAGVGYWEDVAGRDRRPGAQVVVRDGPDAPWRADRSFPGTLRMDSLRSFTFTTDGRGRRVTPVSMLLAAPGNAVSGDLSVWSRDDATGMWTEMVLARLGRTAKGQIRALGFHHDPVTGVDDVFAGAGLYSGEGIGIFHGVYDPTAPGRIQWDPTPEFTDYRGRPMAFAEADGVLHVTSLGAMYRRSDGPAPSWIRVFSYDRRLIANNSGLRGLTAIPNPSGHGQVLLVALEGKASRIYRIDPAKKYKAVVELDIVGFLRQQWKTQNRLYVIPAYNDMPVVPDPQNGHSVLLIGLQAHSPQPGKETSAWYLVRHSDARYELHAIAAIAEPKRSNPALVAVRAIAISPFPADAGRVVYFGGYDCNSKPAHDTAWMYEVGITDVLGSDRLPLRRRAGNGKPSPLKHAAHGPKPPAEAGGAGPSKPQADTDPFPMSHALTPPAVPARNTRSAAES